VRAGVGIIICRGVVLRVFLEGLYVGMTGLGAAGPSSIERNLKEMLVSMPLMILGCNVSRCEERLI
jgi:hypothetical protein